MRVAEIARLTGTTVRTVRYYHSLGLLPVPAERGGWRDYELSHVARLSRIRWLVQAGVSLEAIERVLDESCAAAENADASRNGEVGAEAGAAPWSRTWPPPWRPSSSTWRRPPGSATCSWACWIGRSTG